MIHHMNENIVFADSRCFATLLRELKSEIMSIEKANTLLIKGIECFANKII